MLIQVIGSRRLLTYSRIEGDEALINGREMEKEKKKATADELNAFRKKVRYNADFEIVFANGLAVFRGI
jgi:mevalonate pyrophosphate decarboxylase